MYVICKFPGASVELAIVSMANYELVQMTADPAHGSQENDNE